MVSSALSRIAAQLRIPAQRVRSATPAGASPRTLAHLCACSHVRHCLVLGNGEPLRHNNCHESLKRQWERDNAKYSLRSCPKLSWGAKHPRVDTKQEPKAKRADHRSAVLHHSLKVHDDLWPTPLRASTACHCGRFIVAKIGLQA